MIFTKKTKKVAAFTLVELMVALGIYLLMAGLIFANQDKFNQSLEFSNLGYDIALTIRQAQTYGYAVRGEASGSNTSFTNAFGVHFDASKPSSFMVFYEPIQGPLASVSQSAPQPYSSSDTTLSTYNLQNNYKISNLCYGIGNGCGTPQHASCGASSLDIVFQRPNINAFIYSSNDALTLLPEASVELQSPAGENECVSVFSSGDIEVSTTTAVAPS